LNKQKKNKIIIYISPEKFVKTSDNKDKGYIEKKWRVLVDGLGL